MQALEVYSVQQLLRLSQRREPQRLGPSAVPAGCVAGDSNHTAGG